MFFSFLSSTPPWYSAYSWARPNGSYVQFFIVVACLFTLVLTLILIGLASILLYPEATDVPVVPHIVRNILPAGLKGLAMAGLFATTMATFDSFLHAAGLTLVHDVINPLCKSLGNALNALEWVRHVTGLIGLMVIGIALTRVDNLYSRALTTPFRTMVI